MAPTDHDARTKCRMRPLKLLM